MSALKPMSTAPIKPLLAVHFERGPVEISPYHEANYWLSARQPDVKHWYLTGDEEAGSFDDSEFDGWITEQAE